MTHSLHRIGSESDLRDDFVVMLMSSKFVNRKGSGPKFRQFLEMALDYGALKIGDSALGNEYWQGGVDKVLQNLCDESVVAQCVFKEADSITKFLKAVKKAEFGLSVIVSGVFDEVWKICKEVGIEPHTVNQSLGRCGRTDRLPSKEILKLNTMCGHGMVTVGLIREVIEDVRAARCTAEEGAERLFRPCVCGIFNPYRAARLLSSMARKSKAK